VAALLCCREWNIIGVELEAGGHLARGGDPVKRVAVICTRRGWEGSNLSA
jgi:hypothetical protein